MKQCSFAIYPQNHSSKNEASSLNINFWFNQQFWFAKFTNVVSLVVQKCKLPTFTEYTCAQFKPLKYGTSLRNSSKSKLHLSTGLVKVYKSSTSILHFETV